MMSKAASTLPALSSAVIVGKRGGTGSPAAACAPFAAVFVASASAPQEERTRTSVINVNIKISKDTFFIVVFLS
jgi:hypothetical protein